MIYFTLNFTMKTQAEGINRLQAFLTLICLYPLANDQSGKPLQCEVKCTDRVFTVRQCLNLNVQQDTGLKQRSNQLSCEVACCFLLRCFYF